jgi:hypothetical protein
MQTSHERAERDAATNLASPDDSSVSLPVSTSTGGHKRWAARASRLPFLPFDSRRKPSPDPFVPGAWAQLIAVRSSREPIPTLCANVVVYES